MLRTGFTILISVAVVIYLLSRIDADKRVALYETWQEVLMYEIEPERPLNLSVPGDATRLVLDMLALTEPQQVYDPKRTYPFEVDVLIKPTMGDEKRLRLWLAPRVSLSEFPPRPASLRGARVMDNSIWATDAVERLIDLPAILKGYPAQVTIRPVRGPYPTLLLRVFAERRNIASFGDTRARRLSRDERSTLGALGSALGFLDLPSAAVQQAVSTFRVRLDSTGKRGRDYTLRRVLLSSYRASAAAMAARPSFEVAQDRWVAINLQRDTTFEVFGPPLATVLYGIGYAWTPSRQLSLDENGAGKIEVGTTRPTTLVIGTARPLSLSLQADSSIDEALASDLGNLVRFNGTVLVEPDRRRTTWTRLHPEEPVCFEVDAEEKAIRLSARGIGSGHERLRGTRVYVRPNSRARDWSSPFVMSQFERFVTGELATDSVTKNVRLEQGAQRVCVLGPTSVALRASARDESVLEDEYDAPYDAIAARGFIVHYAPHRERKWASLAPLAPDGESLAGPRSIELFSQVRLTPIDVAQAEEALLARDAKNQATRGRGKPGSGRDLRHSLKQTLEGARVLVPTSLIHAQRIFVASDHRVRGREAWVEISEPRSILVPSEGQLSLAVRAPASRLPAKVEVLVDGTLHTSLDMRVSVLSASLSVAEGTHRLSILAPEGVRAFVRGRASDYEPVWLERQGFELLPGQTLSFDFDARRSEPLAVSLQVFSEASTTPYRVQASLDGMLPQTFVGLTNDHPRVRFWDRDFERPGGLLQASFDLPRARADGARSLEISSKGPERLFVRVVLLGQQSEARPSSVRVGRRKDR